MVRNIQSKCCIVAPKLSTITDIGLVEGEHAGGLLLTLIVNAYTPTPRPQELHAFTKTSVRVTHVRSRIISAVLPTCSLDVPQRRRVGGVR